MASGPRPTARPGAGPGRGRSRTRTATKAGAKTGAKTQAESPRSQPVADAPEIDSAVTAPALRRRNSITTRAIALAVVILILTISYANSVRVYLAQSREIAATQAEIADRQQRIASLQNQVDQWNDPAYVAIQARDRLGWAKPGETGYIVVDEDGNPLGGGTEISAPDSLPTGPAPAWYAKLWGSVEAADKPTPKATKPKKQKTITEDTVPSSTPTPR